MRPLLPKTLLLGCCPHPPHSHVRSSSSFPSCPRTLVYLISIFGVHWCSPRRDQANCKWWVNDKKWKAKSYHLLPKKNKILNMKMAWQGPPRPEEVSREEPAWVRADITLCVRPPFRWSRKRASFYTAPKRCELSVVDQQAGSEGLYSAWWAYMGIFSRICLSILRNNIIGALPLAWPWQHDLQSGSEISGKF